MTGSEQEDLKRCQEAIQLTWLLVSDDHDDQDNFSSFYVDFKHKLSSQVISGKVLREVVKKNNGQPDRKISVIFFDDFPKRQFNSLGF